MTHSVQSVLARSRLYAARPRRSRQVCPGMPAMHTGKEQTKNGWQSPDARCAMH
jgi:hypothetical protein